MFNIETLEKLSFMYLRKLILLQKSKNGANVFKDLYAEIVKRDTLLQSCSESDDVTSLIIGTLTAEEDHRMNELYIWSLVLALITQIEPKKSVMINLTPQTELMSQNPQRLPVNLRNHNLQPVVMIQVIHMSRQHVSLLNQT